MARTALTVTPISRAGVLQPAQQNSDVANGNSLPNNTGGIMLEVQNTIAGARTVTIGIPTLVDGLGVGSSSARVITLANSSFTLIGPFPPGVYNQADGSVNIDCSGTSGDVKFRVYQIF